MANHQSSIINHQSSNSFVIRTPTATVTDLGTEFGVDVSREGVTETHVFVGSVKVAQSSDKSGSGTDKSCVPAVRFDWVARAVASWRSRRVNGSSYASCRRRLSRLDAAPSPTPMPSWCSRWDRPLLPHGSGEGRQEELL